MKVLVTYFSQSGNTEKIAKAIWEEASQENEADLKKLQDVKQSSWLKRRLSRKAAQVLTLLHFLSDRSQEL